MGSPRPLLGRPGSAAADLLSLVRCGLQAALLQGLQRWGQRTFHVSSVRLVPAVANTPLCGFLLVYPKSCIWPLFHLPCGLLNSDIFSETLHRKLPGRKFAFHIRISMAVPEPAGGHFLYLVVIYFDISSVLSRQRWAQSVCGWQPPLETEPRKSTQGSEACVQSTGMPVTYM